MDDASLHVRESTHAGVAGDYSEHSWKRPGVAEGLAHWMLGMTHDIFRLGCVTEKFTYIFCLYVVTGAGDKQLPDICVQAVLNVTKWLEAEMYVLFSVPLTESLTQNFSHRCDVEPDLLERRQKAFT